MPITPNYNSGFKTSNNFRNFRPIDERTLDEAINHLVDATPSISAVPEYNQSEMNVPKISYNDLDDLNNIFENQKIEEPVMTEQEKKIQKIKESMGTIYGSSNQSNMNNSYPHQFDSKMIFNNNQEMIDYFNRMNNNLNHQIMDSNIPLSNITSAPMNNPSNINIVSAPISNLQSQANFASTTTALKHNAFPSNVNNNNMEANFGDFSTIGNEFNNFKEFGNFNDFNEDPFFSQNGPNPIVSANPNPNAAQNFNLISENVKEVVATEEVVESQSENREIIQKIIHDSDSSCKSSSDSVCSQTCKEKDVLNKPNNVVVSNDSLQDCLTEFNKISNNQYIDENKENIYPTFSELDISQKYRDSVISMGAKHNEQFNKPVFQAHNF